MIIAELPVGEELRLLDLESYEIMDTGAENDFDELVELAAEICNCPISTITLLDQHRQWFKAKHGITKTSTIRDIAFCSHAILQDNVMTVEDAVKDLRFVNNPLVTGEEDNIRFYAGAPIFSPGGYKLGTICVIDHIPKKLSPKEEKALNILSNQVTKLLELRRKNALIRQRAAEMLTYKSNAIMNMIEKQEHEKSDLAYNLHEDIAQRLTSVMLYMRMAKGDQAKTAEFLATADNELNEVLNIVRNLSYNITPYATKWVAAEDLIYEFIDKTEDTFPFTIHFTVIETAIKKPSENALLAIRIIQLWLKFLSERKAVTKVLLTVQPGEQLEMTIENNGPLIDFEELKHYVFESSIFERVKTNAGIVDVSVSPKGNNVLKVILVNAISPE